VYERRRLSGFNDATWARREADIIAADGLRGPWIAMAIN
jgi:hypothetical protein